MRLGTARNSTRGLSFTRGLVIGVAGLDLGLCIAIPVGHGLGEVRQLVGLNEGDSRKDRRRKLTKVPVQPPREGREGEYRSTKETKAETEAESDKTGSARDTGKQISIKRGASQLRKANEKPRPAPSLVFNVFSPARS